MVAIDGPCVADPEIQGILDRIAELIRELSKEYEAHLSDLIVTERAKNLYGEALIKVRAALDMVFLRVWRKHTSAVKKPSTQRQVKFPIAENPAKFDEYMISIGLEPNKLPPELAKLIRQAQPFSGATAISKFRDAANAAKHVELPRHIMKAMTARRFKLPNGAELTMTDGCRVNGPVFHGAPVDQSTGLPDLPGEDIELVSLVPLGSESHDPIGNCLSLQTALRRYVPKLIEFA